MRIATANRHRRRVSWRARRAAERAFHEARVARLSASGHLDRLRNSAYTRRRRQIDRALRGERWT